MPAQLPEPIIESRKRGDIRVHTFTSAYTYDNIANSTHIIESKNTLVLIDGQFLTPYAKKFRDYANSLKKPIARLYLSHRHPDHWFGLGTAFDDIPIFALSETIEFIKEHGEDSRKGHVQKLGDLAPAKIVVPTNVAKPQGEDIIDGVRYVFQKVVDTEIDFLLTIGLPDFGVYIAQDLLYSGTHLYLTQYGENWIQVLQTMLRSDYDLFLPGHGCPADRAEVHKHIEYLSAAQQAISNKLTKYAFRDFMIQRYPERKCQGIFDIYLPRLFDGASQV